MLSARTQAIKDSLFANPRQVSCERARLYMESYLQTEGESPVIRRAKALKHVLESHVIVVDDHDLLVGNRSETPRAGIVSPEMSPYWILDELDKFSTRPQDVFEISDEVKTYYKEVLYPYWKGKSLNDWYKAHLDDDVAEAQKSKVFAVAQTDKGQGHIICDYKLVLERGFGSILAEICELEAANPENEFYQAAHMVIQAQIDYILRYREVVLDKLASEESLTRKEELERMASVLQHISTEPASDLYEALQLVWIICVVLQHESNASSLSLGRMDQYLYPYYKASKEQGMKEEEIRELLTCFYLKTNTIVAIRSTESARFFAGFPIGYNLVVSGCDAEGNDVTNELSYLLLDLQKDTRLPQPNLSVRMGSNTPNDLLVKSGEIIRLGDGLPQVFNDEVNIPAFINRGISPDDAADYAVVGCVELSIPGRMYGLHDISMFNMLKCLEICLHEHPEGFESFEELLSETQKTIDYYIDLMVKGCNICDLAHKETSPTPYLSVLVHDALENGCDITAGGARYNPSGVQGVGTANLADSLQVIKEVIHTEGRFTYADLLELLDSDWQCEGGEELREHFIEDYPKYGNDIDEVDELGSMMLAHFGEVAAQYKNPRGGFFQPGSYTVSAHIPLGSVVGATPDGRRATEQLADGGLSPMCGRDVEGPTASLMSVSKLNNMLNSNGSLLNVKFSPATLATDSGVQKLAAYLRAFSRLGIQHIQFNVVDRDTLRDAQKHPENYKNLIVRVAGYSAMFTELSEPLQNDIINRTEHVL